MKHEDKFEALMLRINPPRKYSLTDAAIRPHPRFADLSEFSKGESFTASIPTVIKTWWVVGLFAIVALWIVLPPIGITMGFIEGFYDNRGRFTRGYYNPMPIIITIGVLLATTYATLRAIFPRITITATRDGISVGKYRYNWDNAEGLRAGYSVGGVEKVTNKASSGSNTKGYAWPTANGAMTCPTWSAITIPLPMLFG